MANLPNSPNQPPSVKSFQKLLELLKEQKKTNEKLDILIELQSTNVKILKIINTWMAGRIIIALGFLVIGLWALYQTIVSINS